MTNYYGIFAKRRTQVKVQPNQNSITLVSHCLTLWRNGAQRLMQILDRMFSLSMAASRKNCPILIQKSRLLKTRLSRRMTILDAAITLLKAVTLTSKASTRASSTAEQSQDYLSLKVAVIHKATIASKYQGESDR